MIGLGLIVYSLIFVTSTVFILILHDIVYNKKQLVQSRLSTIKLMNDLVDEDDDELREPFIDRVIKPAYERVVQAISNATPNEIKKRYEELIASSGSPTKVTFSSVLAKQVIFAIFSGGLIFIIYQSIGLKANFMLIFISAIIGFALPYVSLNSKSEKRKSEILSALPDMLDLLYVSVEAGLAFDMGMKKTAEKTKGPLSEEMRRAMDDISKGRNREDALKGIVTRTKVDDINTFVTSIIQAEKLGSNIAGVLRVQSITMRQMRRQRAQEFAAKIPVKMLFPLVLFLFPALFVVILGPAAINIMETLLGM